jgi:hypothetical protein
MSEGKAPSRGLTLLKFRTGKLRNKRMSNAALLLFGVATLGLIALRLARQRGLDFGGWGLAGTWTCVALQVLALLQPFAGLLRVLRGEDSWNRDR